MRTSLHPHVIRLAVSLHDRDRARRLRRRRRCDASTTPPVAAATTDPPASTVAAATTEAVDTTTATTVKVTTTTAAATTTQAAPTTPAPTTAPPAVPLHVAGGRLLGALPGRADARRRNPRPLPDGSVVDLVLVSYQLDDVFIATARSQYPDGYVLDVPVALQGAQDQAVANVGATLISSEDITLQGRPGKQFSASLTSGGGRAPLLQRVYLDGLVLYQQVVSGAGERTFTDPDLATFFDSFAFTTG